MEPVIQPSNQLYLIRQISLEVNQSSIKTIIYSLYRNGMSALMAAVQIWNPDMLEMVEILLRAGSNINLVNNEGKNALMIAVRLNAGRDVRPGRAWWEDVATAETFASLIHGLRQVVLLLLHRGIGVGQYDIEGQCAYEIAIEGKNSPDQEIMKYLFVAGGSSSQRCPKPRALNDLSNGQVPPLQHVCRDIIREQLVLTNMDTNLFKIIPKLNLPLPILAFLLYEVELPKIDCNVRKKAPGKNKAVQTGLFMGTRTVVLSNLTVGRTPARGEEEEEDEDISADEELAKAVQTL